MIIGPRNPVACLSSKEVKHSKWAHCHLSCSHTEATIGLISDRLGIEPDRLTDARNVDDDGHGSRKEAEHDPLPLLINYKDHSLTHEHSVFPCYYYSGVRLTKEIASSNP